MSQFEREERYRVLKIKDVEAALTSNEIELLNRLSHKVADYRQGWEKDYLECVAVESDWPIYEQVWEMVQRMAEGETQRIDLLEAKIQELQRSLDLQWQASQRAIKLWQQETGKDMVWPDKADLCVWLMQQNEQLRQHMAEAKAKIDAYELLPRLIARQQAD